MGVINKTTAQINDILRKCSTPYMLAVSKASDVADTLTISVGQANTFVALPLTVDVAVNTGFTIVGSTITYTGPTALFMFDGTITLGSNANNTKINLRLAKNGVPISDTDSEGVIDTTASRENFNACTVVTLNTNDVVAVTAKADRACTISAYHPQLRLKEL